MTGCFFLKVKFRWPPRIPKSSWVWKTPEAKELISDWWNLMIEASWKKMQYRLVFATNCCWALGVKLIKTNQCNSLELDLFFLVFSVFWFCSLGFPRVTNQPVRLMWIRSLNMWACGSLIADHIVPMQYGKIVCYCDIDILVASVEGARWFCLLIVSWRSMKFDLHADKATREENERRTFVLSALWILLHVSQRYALFFCVYVTFVVFVFRQHNLGQKSLAGTGYCRCLKKTNLDAGAVCFTDLW